MVFPLNRIVDMLHRLLWICSNSWPNSASDNDHALNYVRSGHLNQVLYHSFKVVFQRIPIIGITVYSIYSTVKAYTPWGNVTRQQKEDGYDDAFDE